MQGQIPILDPLAIAAIDMMNRSICVSNHADNVEFKSLMTNKHICTLWKEKKLSL